MEKSSYDCSPSCSTEKYTDAGSTAPLLASPPHGWNVFPSKKTGAIQRIWDGARKFCKATKATSSTRKCDTLARKRTGTNAKANHVHDTLSKPTMSNNTIPINTFTLIPNNAFRRIPDCELRINFNGSPFPRLTELVRSDVDTEKVLRSILVFIMFISFYVNPYEIQDEMDNLFPWDREFPCDEETPTRTDDDSSKSFPWSIVDITNDLSVLVRHLHKSLNDGRWFLVRRDHKELLRRLVLQPAMEMGMQAGYILEILGFFRQEPQGEMICFHTLLDYRNPFLEGIQPSLSTLGILMEFGDTVASHVLVINSLQLQEGQQSKLEDAVVEYLKEEKMEKLRTSNAPRSNTDMNEIRCSPNEDGYPELFFKFLTLRQN